jgi:hypothetical protein
LMRVSSVGAKSSFLRAGVRHVNDSIDIEREQLFPCLGVKSP